MLLLFLKTRTSDCRTNPVSFCPLLYDLDEFIIETECFWSERNVGARKFHLRSLVHDLPHVGSESNQKAGQGWCPNNWIFRNHWFHPNTTFWTCLWVAQAERKNFNSNVATSGPTCRKKLVCKKTNLPRMPLWSLVGLTLVVRLRGDGPLYDNSHLCNPARGNVRYLRIGNAGPITTPECFASWDLHEVEIFSPTNQRISTTVSQFTGFATGYPAENAIDGDTTSFWAGDHEVGMACVCWSSEKIDKQAITLDMGSEVPVGAIHITQGNNIWAMETLQITCGDRFGVFDFGAPLVLNVSWEITKISCSTTSGCAVTYKSQTPDWVCEPGTTSLPTLPPASSSQSYAGYFLLLTIYVVLFLSWWPAPNGNKLCVLLWRQMLQYALIIFNIF